MTVTDSHTGQLAQTTQQVADRRSGPAGCEGTFGLTPKITRPSTRIPSGVFSRLRSVRISNPAPTSSTTHIVICSATMILPTRDLPASAFDVAAEVLIASSALPASATRNGARPNSKPAMTKHAQREQQHSSVRSQARFNLCPPAQLPGGDLCEDPRQRAARRHKDQTLRKQLAEQFASARSQCLTELKTPAAAPRYAPAAASPRWPARSAAPNQPWPSICAEDCHSSGRIRENPLHQQSSVRDASRRASATRPDRYTPPI